MTAPHPDAWYARDRDIEAHMPPPPTLMRTLALLRSDLKRWVEMNGRKPTFLSTIASIGRPAPLGLAIYRFAHYFHRHGRRLLGWLCWSSQQALTKMEIVPWTSVGTGCYIQTAASSILGGAVIGNNCTFLGTAAVGGRASRDGRPLGFPVIGDNVVVGSNAVIQGGIQIGDGAIILANTIVHRDVPPGAVVSGNRAHIQGWRRSYVEARGLR